MDFYPRSVGSGGSPVSSRCKSESEAVYPSSSRVCAVAVLLATFAALAACGASDGRMEPVYDATSGRLELLKYDANSDGRVDTWSYMDGPRIVRIEIDTDHNDVIDRWEYYAADETLEKVGSSRVKDGKPDTWAYYAPGGSLARLELSLKRDGQVDRTEYYAAGSVSRAEEDTNRDGRTDKWEAYEGQRLVSVGFDTTFKGASPDRRLVYGSDGTVRAESIPALAPSRP